MRKLFSLLLILLLLCSGGVIHIHQALYPQRDRVEYVAETWYGDAEAAQGLSVFCGMEYENRLIWDTTFQTENLPSTQTQFSFFSEEVIFNQSAEEYSGVSLESYFEYGCDFKQPAEEQDGIAKAYKQLYDVTPVGEERKKTIRLADYYDYYPLHLRLDIPGSKIRFLDISYGDAATEDQKKIMQAFETFFKLPLSGEETVEISIDRTNGSAVGIGSGEYNTHGMYTESICTDNAAYFTFNTQYKTESSEKLQTMDVSQINGGYGIYKLPFTQEPDKETVIHAEQLEMVYALDPSNCFQGIYLSPSQKQLLLFTLEEQVHVLTVIELETMKTLQRIELNDGTQNIGLFNVFIEEQFMVLGFNNNRILLLENNERGEYTIQMDVHNTVEDIAPQEYYFWDDYTAFAYDGEKLAMISPSRTNQWVNLISGDLITTVFDRSGLRYCGQFKSTLTARIGPNEYRYYAKLYGPLKASWQYS